MVSSDFGIYEVVKSFNVRLPDILPVDAYKLSYRLNISHVPSSLTPNFGKPAMNFII